MSQFKLPNIRKIFKPDPGYVLFDADLSGADAQVVAWEADDVDLKKAFRAGVKIHDKNATDIFGNAYTLAGGVEKRRIYQQSKSGVHATNYGGSAKALSLNGNIGWPIDKCVSFQQTWFRLHPGIKTNFHGKVNRSLSLNRTISNKFGYRIIFYDRIDSIFPEALAWIPQSTVAEVCFRGALQLRDMCPWAEILIQVHDSLVFQVPGHCEDRIPAIRRALPVPIPYDDPLVIPWGLKSSSVSWGDVKEVPK